MSKKEKNSKKTTQETKKKPTGFQKYPENINKKGRPKKGMSISEIMREYLDEVDKNDKTRKEILIEKIYKMATKEDLAAIKYIMDRMEGRPKEKVETENEHDINIKIEWE